MGAWNLTAGLVLFVLLHNIQVLEAVPKDPEFRQFYEAREIKVLNEQRECVAKWRATIGDPCISENELDAEIERLRIMYKDDIPRNKYKEAFEGSCQQTLFCSVTLECQCKGSSVDSSSCGDPKKDLNKNCDREVDAYLKLQTQKRNEYFRRTDPPTRSPRKVTYHPRSSTTGRNVTATGSSNTTSSVSDPGQNFQYITLMANIFFVFATH